MPEALYSIRGEPWKRTRVQVVAAAWIMTVITRVVLKHARHQGMRVMVRSRAWSLASDNGLLGR
jgi:hypothetical protein